MQKRGLGEIVRVCWCGNIFRMFDNGYNSWKPCTSCIRRENEENGFTKARSKTKANKKRQKEVTLVS